MVRYTLERAHGKLNHHPEAEGGKATFHGHTAAMSEGHNRPERSRKVCSASGGWL